MDFIEGLPCSGSFNCSVVVIDRLSMDADFTGLHHPFSAQDVVEVFMHEVCNCMVYHLPLF